MGKELWYRHLIKTGIWRVLAFLILCVVSYITTGSVAVAAGIATVDWVIKTIMYFVYEVAWSKTNFGRQDSSCKKGGIIWLTGLSGSGKTTLADEVARRLEKRNVSVKRLDGDVARRTFSKDLGFSLEDRAENCRRAAHVGSYLAENNIVLASFISPTYNIRREIRGMGAKVIYVDTHIAECEKRDPKGMYKKLKYGKFMGVPFTGMHPSAPYERPLNPDLHIRTQNRTVEECADEVIEFLEQNGYV